MLFDNEFISENQQVLLKEIAGSDVELWIKREDKIHEFVSGNKFRKLKHNISEAKRYKHQSLLTFGGAYSNHIVATAVAGNLSGLKTIGVVRGEELAENFEEVLKTNQTLKVAHEHGMEFKFVSRTAYRDKTETNFINSLRDTFGDFYLIPEGGTNPLAIKGCEEILSNEDQKFDYICTAVGTGGTISGLINSVHTNQEVIGFPALKGNFLYDEIRKYTTKENWTLNLDYNFRGYGKFNEDLIHFINIFKSETSILLDPIYTGKMLFGIVDLINKGKFKKGSKILAIHTGGIQGIDGINKKLLKKNIDLIKV
ncbi:1-aminocyclopropane-1-carboxylate deaminase/D-cysteine desulfhydrase [uncultured Tenacibaculum sp.]|uniref:1-aminocyclopropane-1-carboxylate deaminase/D-cysteine desulfhydrase n=1 Tax=uncultured Tenacibaculum sp. TaxID=174713 RepID=UPI0026305E37|nr:pyridoxal-phosphate dependent enzyme [uncultured Tenacibaculum sp.]